MNRILVVLIGSLLLLGTAFFVLSRGSVNRSATNGQEPLILYCAASNRAPMESIVSAYQKETGRIVQVQYGASQTLLSSFEVSKTGDLYLPADDSYMTMAKEDGMIDEVLLIAKMHPVLAVAKGNPKAIHSLKDISKDGVRYVSANPDAAAIGKICRQVLTPSGEWDKLQEVSIGVRLTVNDVASDIAIDAADAGFVYDAVLHSFSELEAVHIPELSEAVSKVSIGVLRSTKNSAAALHFARYVAARDRGLNSYKEHGFEAIAGDVWEDVPQLAVYAGSMLKPAIEDTIAVFEKREGVAVSRIYNGCGILVAQMKAGQHPDAYFACDTEFMSQVPDLFPEPLDVSQNELVIMVQKGNPHGIKELIDLSKPGLRVGIGHEKQCAMGWLTQNTFREAGITQEVMENVSVQTPSGDMLVNQMQAGALDASVAYISNAAGAGEFLDAIRIPGLKCSIATQPFAIAVDSPRAQTTGRLLDRILSAESQEIFQAEGFRWMKSKDD